MIAWMSMCLERGSPSVQAFPGPTRVELLDRPKMLI